MIYLFTMAMTQATLHIGLIPQLFSRGNCWLSCGNPSSAGSFISLKMCSLWLGSCGRLLEVGDLFTIDKLAREIGDRKKNPSRFLGWK